MPTCNVTNEAVGALRLLFPRWCFESSDHTNYFELCAWPKDDPESEPIPNIILRSDSIETCKTDMIAFICRRSDGGCALWPDTESNHG